MPERTYSAGSGYRYGFNGKENDNEVSGQGNQYDYGFRIYNPRLGRFLSVDPLIRTYPMLTPYQFASNSPIAAIDLDGKESIVAIYKSPAYLTLISQPSAINLRVIAETKVDLINLVIQNLKIPNYTYSGNSNLSSKGLDQAFDRTREFRIGLTPFEKDEIVRGVVEAYLVFTDERIISTESFDGQYKQEIYQVTGDLNYELLEENGYQDKLEEAVNTASQTIEIVSNFTEKETRFKKILDQADNFITGYEVGKALSEKDYWAVTEKVSEKIIDWGLEKLVGAAAGKISMTVSLILSNSCSITPNSDKFDKYKEALQRQTIAAMSFFFMRGNKIDVKEIIINQYQCQLDNTAVYHDPRETK